MSWVIACIVAMLINWIDPSRLQGADDPFEFMRGSKLKRNGKSICDFQEINSKSETEPEKGTLRYVQEIGHNGEILNEWEKICPEAKVVPEKPMREKSILYRNIWIAVHNQDLENLKTLFKQCTSQETRQNFIKKYPLLLHHVIEFYLKNVKNIEKNRQTIDTIEGIVNNISEFGYSMDKPDIMDQTPSKLMKNFYTQCGFKINFFLQRKQWHK